MSIPAIIISRADRKRLTDIAVEAIDCPRPVPTGAILLGELARAKIVDKAKLPASVVAMHSAVLIRDDISGGLSRVTLVYPGEDDPAAGRISVLTPLGAALIGLSEGDTISWCTLTGDPRKVTVVRIVRPGHAASRPARTPGRRPTRKEERG
jgi:regulator of nucleoside diphosphate kinase